MKNRKFMVSLALLIIIFAFVGYFAVSKRDVNGSRKKVYAVLSLTGSLADVGNLEKKTIEAYVKNHNSMLDIVYIDSAFDPTKALSALQQAMIGDPNPLVLTSCTSIAAAIAPFVGGNNGSTICTGTTELDEIDKTPSAQRISTLGQFSAGAVAEYIGKRFNSVVVIYSDNDYGLKVLDSFKESLAKDKTKVIGTFPMSVKDPNVRELVARALRLKSESIYVTSAATPAFINVFRELKSQAYQGKIFADTTFTVPSVARALGDLTKDIIFSCFDSDMENPETSKGKEFKDLCLRAGIPANFLAIEVYDSMSVLEHMIVQNLPITKETFTKMGKFPSVTGEIRFEKVGNAEYKCELGTIVDHKIVKVK